MLKQEDGFTLVEVMMVIAIIGILASLSFPKFKAYLEYLELATATNKLVMDLQWARQQAIIKKVKYGVVFYQADNKYQIIKDEAVKQIIKEVDLKESKVKLGKISFYYSDGKSTGQTAVFFKTLGNIDGGNGSVELVKLGYGTKKIIFSSNAGELNVE
ncbi:type IV fimbrial biogenesis protein FimT [Orenia metallireducens]|jgi:type IV fimbrial biogenesis protein FimT|uniref:Type IV fimbrial biogenesis protein FimT n=1 Tax=Orenia metallireducens TaxID=1413210 RepID=A0A285I5A6_9FIRM|nr:prepilin-type N-terminal cleavage/methylation domain-containing protein [Orenia metallireducens]PRX19722.1 type IV fimbrial biogenesis protein FimT [Orenia metallireducens]SNY43148.1 type IV fimbrial biogenesis protein FimT [Orenia metallireducens]